MRRPNLKDITGQRFGRLVARRLSRKTVPSGGAMWLCRCDCGRRKLVWGVALRNGLARSCGCLMGNRKHGQTAGGRRTGSYNSWRCMIGRCTKPTDKNWERYGGRGIKVTRRWQGPHGLEHFLRDMGPRPDGKTLDRKDNNGNYTRRNCRWATPL